MAGRPATLEMRSARRASHSLHRLVRVGHARTTTAKERQFTRMRAPPKPNSRLMILAELDAERRLGSGAIRVHSRPFAVVTRTIEMSGAGGPRFPNWQRDVARPRPLH